MYILGFSAFYHDSAACLIKDGNVVAAAQEERFTRVKHDASFPANSIRFCLEKEKIIPAQIENFVFYEKPFLKFERLLETYLAFAPKGFKSFSSAMPSWIKEKLFQKRTIKTLLVDILGDNLDLDNKLLFSQHHLSHAASAFFPSPFKSSAILTLDGVGEWTTTSISIGDGNKINFEKEIYFPHSLGLLYSAFTFYTGFKVNSGEYKLMGLAPYGNPRYVDLIKDNLINIFDDGSFQLNMSYFDFATGLKMTNKKFDALFDGPARSPENILTQKEMDLAASVQKVTEEIMLKICYYIANTTKQKNLCLAGGVALNCVANGLLYKEKIFDNIWIQPASGDAGGSIGAALATYYMYHLKKRSTEKSTDAMKGSYLGPSFCNNEIESSLKSVGAKFLKVKDNELISSVTDAICQGKAIGWMQGPMEFGPRALGSRSIIADPRSSNMQRLLNLKVKFRESFRPFAPSILYEHVNNWFEYVSDSPYMLLVDKIKKEKCREMTKAEKNLFGIEKLNVVRSSVPAVTHVDYSARVQTVHKETNPLYHRLISNFFRKTGVPILVNTSFNVRGEPIVCSPEDAFKCFMGTELDILALGNYILYKEEQDSDLLQSYKDKYELD